MGVACFANGGNEKCIRKFKSENLKGEDNLGDPGIGWEYNI